jgi:hypothetical protein
MKSLMNITKGILTIILVAISGYLFANFGVVEGSILLMAGAATNDTLSESWLKSINATILDNTVVDKITEIFPGQMPLTSIMRQVKKKKQAQSFKVDYYSIDARGDNDTVATEYTEGSAGSQDLSAAVEVNNPSMWNKHDTVLAKGVTNADGEEVEFLITSVQRSASTITLQPINNLGTSTQDDVDVMPTLEAETNLVRLATAKSELDASTDAYSDVPTDEYNYMQIYMAQIEESLFHSLHKQRAKWSLKDMERRNLWDMMNKMELSWILGTRKYLYDLEAEDHKYLTGGLKQFAGRKLEYGYGSGDATVTPSTLVNWSKQAFADNNGSDYRLVFVGKDLAESLQNVGLITDSSNELSPIREKSLSITPVDKWDFRFTRVDSVYGSLLFRYHKGLDRAFMSDEGVMVDINNIDYYQLLPLSVAELEYDKTGTKLAKAKRIMEASGPIFRNSPTHAMIEKAS